MKLNAFKKGRNEFDKEYKRQKRLYQKTKQVEISHLNTENPKEFWSEINKLEPKRTNNNIPMEIIDNDGNIVNDIDTVLNKWEQEYKILTSKIKNDNFSDDYLCDVQNVLKLWESEYSELLTNQDTNYNPGNVQNDSLNAIISLQEIENAIKKQ